LGNPFAQAGLISLAGLGIAAGALGALFGAFKEDKDQIQDMEGVFKNFGEVDTTQFDKGTEAFAAMKQSINEMSGFKLGALAVASAALPTMTARERFATAPRSAGTPAAGGGGDTSHPVTITLDTSETRKFWEAILKGPARVQGNEVIYWNLDI